MPPGVRRLPVARLRAALASAVDAHGLRATARAIGIDHRSLTKLLNGASPRTSTRQKLERWFVSYAAQSERTMDAETASAAVQVLLHDVPPDERSQRAVELVEFVGQVYRRAQLPTPPWVDELLGSRGPPDL